MDELNDYSLLSDPEMKEIVESFLIESKEILERLDTDLIDLEKNPKDVELLNKIFRAFHTIKGTSGFLGLNKLTEVTHICEDILNKLRKGEVDLSTNIMDSILGAYDNIKNLVNSIEVNKNEDVDIIPVIAMLKSTLSEISENTDKHSEEAEKKYPVQEEIQVQIPVEDDNSEEQSETAEEIVDDSEINIRNIDEITPSVTEVKKEIKPVVKQEEKHEDKTVVEAKKSDNTIRVDVERLNDLLNIASELVLGRNRLAQVNSDVALEYEGTKLSRDLSEINKQIDYMTNELQLIVMKVRLIKIGKVFNRFPRVVRDLLKETHKEAQLIIYGEDTELDKTLIEEINDPLVHLIRNSIDHGIESPEDRVAKGKERSGKIILSAEQEGNNIIITIQDDGKGIDPEKILEKAISRGMISKEKVKDFSKQEILNFIFQPGFSMAEKVTNISGRGVGMDVVKTNVAKLRGVINIDSTVNQGTKIIVKLPITLAIIQGMIVAVGPEKVVIPLSTILEVVRVNVEDIHTINSREVIRVRESILPLLEIGKIIYNQERDLTKQWQYVVVVGIAEKRFGIKVDSLIGQKEIVIKSLGNYLGNVQGIAGSTIMGDGSVLMILDLSELINNYTKSIEYSN